MRMAFILMIIVCLFAAAGCATAPISAKGEIDQLRQQLNSLQQELDQQKAENAGLRQQLGQVQAAKDQVRMPNAREIQTALKKAGYYKGEVDGQIGSKTKDAIKKFQQANSMNPDGVVGSRTWQLLSRYLEK